MKDSTSNKFIAITTVVAALLMCAALSFAIGKWSWGKHGYEVTIKFPNATGITVNSEVKFAGAHAGRVKAITLIPRSEETKDPANGMYNCVEVICDIDSTLEVGNDVEATIKQDGFGISAKYVLLTPGPNHDSPALADGETIQGSMPYDLSDLIQPAGDALMQAKQLVAQLQPIFTKLGPTMDRLDSLSEKLTVSLPPLIAHADTFLVNGNSLVANFNTPEARARMNEMLDSLRVSSENLKVVSTNAKALTATLAVKPWRVFWGGPTVVPPTEDAILNSNKVLRLKPDVDVNDANEMPPIPSTTR
jgi:ABC-type transporter Mla subunit MlaD